MLNATTTRPTSLDAPEQQHRQRIIDRQEDQMARRVRYRNREMGAHNAMPRRVRLELVHVLLDDRGHVLQTRSG